MRSDKYNNSTRVHAILIFPRTKRQKKPIESSSISNSSIYHQHQVSIFSFQTLKNRQTQPSENMKLFTTIAIIAVGIATASPAAPLDPREDVAGMSSELKGLPYGMKSKPDCPKFKYYCLHCKER